MCIRDSVIAAKAVAFKEALQPEFKEYQQQILKNASAMADQFIKRGFKVVSGGTDDHLFLVDFIEKGITGKDLERVLGSVNKTVNKNSVPNDPASPFVTSGIRIGTPAVTTRGFKKEEIIQVSNWISEIINDFENEKLQKNIKQEVQNLTSNFPVYNV